ncbi:Oxysterol binding protein, partial [Xylographa opegraphella]|nr:Oxysterol binding protein [Xylographa opegraphella]
SIASFNGDLASLTAPPFILGTISLTEFSGYWAENPASFVSPARGTTPEERAKLVLRWFLTTLKQQYCSRSDSEGNEKKPLNPFLGELHIGQWPSVLVKPAKDAKDDWETGVTTLVSEQ